MIDISINFHNEFYKVWLSKLPIFIEMNNQEIIQQRIKDSNGQVGVKLYQKAQMLGKGGFAKCYRGIELETQKQVAIKIIQKSNLIKNRAKQKLLSQIKIHRALKHPYIVDFQTVFEDDKNVYIILQLCRCRTLGEMVKKRKHLTAAQTRFYIKELLQALDYLHISKVIHRDLKMGNIFLNDQMDIKLGDFGLSAKLEFFDEKKRTMAGTPNYIAPEIIEGTGGHSYEVDLWSTGVICYAMLFGRPPFETSQLKMTYSKIKNCEYSFPCQCTPCCQIIHWEYFSFGPEEEIDDKGDVVASFLKRINSFKDTNACVTDKLCRLKQIPHFSQEELQASSGRNTAVQGTAQILRNTQNFSPQTYKSFKQVIIPISSKTIRYDPELKKHYQNQNSKIDKLKNESGKPQCTTSPNTNLDKINNSTFAPHVQAYVDYSTKYGLGYYFNNDCNSGMTVYGVYFNDSTILCYDENQGKYHYIVNPSQKDELVQIESYSPTNYPDSVKNYSKKKMLLQRFHSHLMEELESKTSKFPKKSQQTKYTSNQGIIYVKQWLKTKHAMMFRLNNKIFQVNFQDNSQILLNTLQREVFFTSKKGQQIQESLSEALSEKNKETELGRRIKYTRQILNSLKKEPKTEKQ